MNKYSVIPSRAKESHKKISGRLLRSFHSLAMTLTFAFCLFTFSLFAQGVWTQKWSFTYTRCLLSAFAIGNNGYIGTGNSLSGLSADLWQYNAPTDTWTQMANLPGAARKRGVGFSANNKGYLGLGMNASSSCLNDLWEFD